MTLRPFGEESDCSDAEGRSSLFASAGYFPHLDAVRGCAVLLVMLFHCHILGCGWIGVQIFFVLSGFLITGVLLRDKEIAGRRAGSLKGYAWRFYRRRILRILPLYSLYLLCLAVGDWYSQRVGVRAPQWVGFVTFTYNFAALWGDYPPSQFYVQLWSLCVEEQFYLFWPFLVYFTTRQQLRRCALFLVAIGPVLRWFISLLVPLVQEDPGQAARAIYHATFSHLDAFASGALLVVTAPEWLRAHRRRLLFLGIGLFFASGIALDALYQNRGSNLSVLTLGFPIEGTGFGQHVWSYSVINFAAASGLLYILTARAPWRFHSLEYVGKVSYGLYLFHHPILGLLLLGLGPWGELGRGAVLVLYFLLSLSVASLSYHLFERRFLGRKR